MTGGLNVHLGTLPCGSPPGDLKLGRVAACVWMASMDKLLAGPATSIGVPVLQPARGVCSAPVSGRHIASERSWWYMP